MSSDDFDHAGIRLAGFSRLRLSALFFASLLTIPFRAFAETPPTPVPFPSEWQVGVRYGIPMYNDFALTEFYGAWSPEGWGCDLCDDFRVRFGLTAAGGALADDHNDLALFAHIGPFAEFVHRPSGLRIVCRSEPSYMSRHALGGVDLGEDFQFVSSLGLYWVPPSNPRWGMGVAMQHISNAGISDVNPGTNHLVFSIGYSF